jgi:hypothetical protein
MQKSDSRSRLAAAASFDTVALESLAETTAVKQEVTSNHTHLLERDIQVLRRDVQFIKDELAEMRLGVNKIPAVLEILGEILGRLPQ